MIIFSVDEEDSDEDEEDSDDDEEETEDEEGEVVQEDEDEPMDEKEKKKKEMVIERKMFKGDWKIHDFYYLQMKKMQVGKGKVHKEDPYAEARSAKENFKLREKLVKNKHQKLHKSMKIAKQSRKKEAWLLKKKRGNLEQNEKEARKQKRKEQKNAE